MKKLLAYRELLFLAIGILIIIYFQLFNYNTPVYVYVFTILIIIIGSYYVILGKNILFSFLLFCIPLSMSISIPSIGRALFPSEIIALLFCLFLAFNLAFKTFLEKKILFHPLTILLIIDILWLIITASTSELNAISFKRVIIRIIYFLVFYIITAKWLMNYQNSVKYFLLYVAGIILPILYISIKHASFSFDTKMSFIISQPFYTDHTLYGACIAYITPFIFITAFNLKTLNLQKYKWFVWIGIIFLTFALIFSYSRAAWISVVFALCMFVFLKLKLSFKFFILSFILTLGIGIFFYDNIIDYAKRNENLSNRGDIQEHLLSVGNLNQDASNLERINRWNSAIKMFKAKPIFGFGPGTYQFKYATYQSLEDLTYISTFDGNKGNAHSESLTYLCETGLLGFISYCIWVVATIYFGFKYYYNAANQFVKTMVLAALLGFFTFFFHSLVNSFIDNLKFTSLLFGSMAIIMMASFYQKESKNNT